MTPDQIRSRIEPLYLELFGPDGYENLEVTAAPDHAGEPAIFINAKIRGEINASLEGRVGLLRDRVFESLRANEDGRFPYVWVQYDDPALDDTERTAPRKRRAS